MEKEHFNYFATAIPVVTDDDGDLGYLWKGIAYLERTHGTGKDFEPSFETKQLFYTPEEAISEVQNIILKQIL